MISVWSTSIDLTEDRLQIDTSRASTVGFIGDKGSSFWESPWFADILVSACILGSSRFAAGYVGEILRIFAIYWHPGLNFVPCESLWGIGLKGKRA